MRTVRLRMDRLQRVALAGFLGLVPACGASRWNGRMETWGTMREALRDAKTQARVSLSRAVDRPHAFGVGALEGLAGEVTIVDGDCWATRVDGQGGVTTDRAPGELKATLLVLAHVPAWETIDVPHDVAPDAIEDFVRDVARQRGLDGKRPFPFQIDGELLSLRAHVIRGQCPMADGVEADHRPYRLDRERASGKLAGIYAEASAGELTHHGSRVHMHVILPETSGITAHVEHVGIHAGGVIRVPRLANP